MSEKKINKGGRPQYEPTPSDRRTVAHMAAAGIPHDRIAQCIGQDGIDDNTLRKHFRRELDTSRDSVTALATAAVIRGIKGGEAWASCFWLKTRAGFRETNAHEFSGPDGGPIEVEDVSPRERLASRIAGIAARGRTQQDNPQPQ